MMGINNERMGMSHSHVVMLMQVRLGFFPAFVPVLMMKVRMAVWMTVLFCPVAVLNDDRIAGGPVIPGDQGADESQQGETDKGPRQADARSQIARQ